MGRYSPINDEKRLYVENLFIDSDREKNSASNDCICNGSYMDIGSLSGQKLIFQHVESAPDVPYYLANIGKNYDIRDQHTLFYHPIKTNNGETKNIFFIHA